MNEQSEKRSWVIFWCEVALVGLFLFNARAIAIGIYHGIVEAVFGFITWLNH